MQFHLCRVLWLEWELRCIVCLFPSLLVSEHRSILWDLWVDLSEQLLEDLHRGQRCELLYVELAVGREIELYLTDLGVVGRRGK